MKPDLGWCAALLLLPGAPGLACEPAPMPTGVALVAEVTLPAPVAKVTIAPDSQSVGVALGDGRARIVRLRDGAVGWQQTGIPESLAVVYAPDGSEVWVIGPADSIARLDPVTGQLNGRDAHWQTSVGGLQLLTLAPGRFRISDTAAQVEVAGSLVIGTAGRLVFGDQLLIAIRPDRVLALRAGALPVAPPPAEVAPVTAMQVACDGRCLVTAGDPAHAYLWRLDPLDAHPVTLAGNPFVNAGDLAIDCTGERALVERNGQLVRVALNAGATPDETERAVALVWAQLSADGRYALVMDANTGWQVLDAATLQPTAVPDWLADEQTQVVIAPDGAHAIWADADDQARLVATPFQEIARLAASIEVLAPRFSPRGGLLALHSAGGFRLLRTANGIEIGVVPGELLLFAPDERSLITIDGALRVYRVRD